LIHRFIFNRWYQSVGQKSVPPPIFLDEGKPGIILQ
jgi:hypothetical protein